MDDVSPDTSAGFAIGRTAHLLSSTWNRQLKSTDWDLSNQEHLILVMADHVGAPIRMSCLAKRLIRDPTTLKRQIGRLIELELLATKKDPTDGRATLVFVTEKGQDVVHTLTPKYEQLRQQVFAGISDHDIEQLTDTLRKVQLNLLSLHDGSPC